MHLWLTVLERWQQSRTRCLRISVQVFAGKQQLDTKEESFEREQCLGLYSPDFHCSSPLISTPFPLAALRGAAWHGTALHSSALALGPDALGFPAGLQQDGLSCCCRRGAAIPLPPSLLPRWFFLPNFNTITRN